MRLHDILRRDSRHPFQSIDILRKTPQQNPLILQQPHKRMRQSRLISPRIQPLCQSIKRFWILAEILERKHRFRVWQVERGQVAVETCSRGSKVGDSRICGDSGADTQDDAFGIARFDVPVFYQLELGDGGRLLGDAVEVGCGEDFGHV